MKIAYIVPSLANRGPVLVVRELVRLFAGGGHECRVFYFDDLVELDFDCPVRRIGSRERIPFGEFDVVHSHGLRPDRYVCRFREYGTRTRYVATVHNYVMPDFRYQYNRAVALVFGNWWMHSLRRHDTVVALSKDAVRYYGRWFPSRKLTYAYNTRSLDLPAVRLTEEETREIESFRRDSALLGMNTLLTERKGADLVIRALRELPSCKLWIVGDGPARKSLERLSEREGVADRCFFAGYRRDAFRYLSCYDVYAMPSRAEGFPLALLEAAVCGRPSVCSRLPVLEETFGEDEVAFFDLGSPASLCDAIRRAIGNEPMGERMRRRYGQSYSPERFYRRYLEIYLNRGDEVR